MFDITLDLKARKTTTSNTEQNRLLIKKIQEGAPEAREEYVTRNIPLVVACVRKFLKTRPTFTYLRDDFLSEGLKVLTKASCNFNSNHDSKQAHSYLVTGIFRAFVWLIRNETREFECPLNEEEEEFLRISPLPAINLKCDIEALAGEHSDIPRLKCEGYTNEEIADRLSISISTIQRKLNDLKKRLDQEYA